MAAGFTKLRRFIEFAISHEGIFTAEVAAQMTGVSVRTVYRYIQILDGLDGGLFGEAGVGYQYRRRK